MKTFFAIIPPFVEAFLLLVLMLIFSKIGRALAGIASLYAMGQFAAWSPLEYIFSGCIVGAVYWITLAYPGVKKLKHIDATGKDVLIVGMGFALALVMMDLSMLLVPTIPVTLMFLIGDSVWSTLVSKLNKYIPTEEG